MVKFWNWRLCWSADCRGIELFILVSEMTNNPDSKAPERIWVSAEYANSPFAAKSKGRYIPADGTEYTRTDAITPQQAAKVLLDDIDKNLRKYIDLLSEQCHGGSSGLILSLRKIEKLALAESKE